MIDVLDHSKRSNLRWFLEKSRKIINHLNESNTVPLLVGGTGQYMWGILEGWDPPIVKPNEKLRLNIEKQIRDQGIKKVIQSYSKIYKLNKNQDLGRNLFMRQLINIQYDRNDFDFSRGKFRVRGDTIDLLPAYKKKWDIELNFGEIK